MEEIITQQCHSKILEFFQAPVAWNNINFQIKADQKLLKIFNARKEGLNDSFQILS